MLYYKTHIFIPIHSLQDWNAAHNFSNGTGVILKLVPDQSSLDRFFDVEWFTNYPQERERVFMFSTILRIENIQTFQGHSVENNIIFIEAFRLWSRLFGGH